MFFPHYKVVICIFVLITHYHFQLIRSRGSQKGANLDFCSYLDPNLLMTTNLQDLFPGIKDLDEKSVYALLNALKNNFDGQKFDYLHYKQSVKSLSAMQMDAATSHKSAFMTASTMGLTKEKLLASAQNYARVLENERESFATALLGQQSQKIEGRKAEVSKFEQKIESHKLKIMELQREIEIFTEKVNSVDQDVELASKKIEGTKAKFLSVYEVLAKEIAEDITTINTYL